MTVSAESRFKTSKLLTSDATLESVHSAGLETVKSVNLVGLNGINLSLVTQLVGALSYGIVLFALECNIYGTDPETHQVRNIANDALRDGLCHATHEIHRLIRVAGPRLTPCEIGCLSR